MEYQLQMMNDYLNLIILFFIYTITSAYIGFVLITVSSVSFETMQIVLLNTILIKLLRL